MEHTKVFFNFFFRFGAMLKIQLAMDRWAEEEEGMHIINTQNLSPEEVADRIINLIV